MLLLLLVNVCAASVAVYVYPPIANPSIISDGGLYVLPATPVTLYAKPALSYNEPCIAGTNFEHTSLYQAITEDCACYAFISSGSNSPVAIVQLEGVSGSIVNVTTQWHLLPISGVRCIPTKLLIMFSQAMLTWKPSVLTIDTFLATQCPFLPAAVHPPPCTIQYSFQVKFMDTNLYNVVNVPQYITIIIFSIVATVFGVILFFFTSIASRST